MDAWGISRLPKRSRRIAATRAGLMLAMLATVEVINTTGRHDSLIH